MNTIAAAPATRTYYGKVYYNHMGEVIEDVGSERIEQAEQIVAAADQRNVGRWCFAVIKNRLIDPSGARWSNVLTTPDGKTRKLIQGEVATAQRSRGRFLTREQVAEAIKAVGKVEVREAPDTYFPWNSGMQRCYLERFKTTDDLVAWIKVHNDPKAVLLVFYPGAHAIAPDEPELYLHMAWLLR